MTFFVPTRCGSIAIGLLFRGGRIRMTFRTQLLLLGLLTFSMPAVAQDSGGVPLAPGAKGGPVGLARPLPFTRPPLVTAHDLQNGLTPADHQATDQNTITNLRGDPGFL